MLCQRRRKGEREKVWEDFTAAAQWTMRENEEAGRRGSGEARERGGEGARERGGGEARERGGGEARERGGEGAGERGGGESSESTIVGARFPRPRGLGSPTPTQGNHKGCPYRAVSLGVPESGWGCPSYRGFTCRPAGAKGWLEVGARCPSYRLWKGNALNP